MAANNKGNADKGKKEEAKKPEPVTGSDSLYKFDEEHVRLVKEQLKDANVNPKFIKNCKISALAAMKMLKHALLGVEVGRKATGTSYEIMGFLVGKPEGDTIIIFDTIPSSTVGFENKVEATDAGLGYMVAVSESLEKKRPERIVGWYHSHPFDVETYSHCHLSSTDTITQGSNQFNQKDFVAIVVDPLRSLAKQEPEFGAFRTYPANHKITVQDECPDGTIMPKEQRLVRWGVSADRYYSLKTSFFMSSLGRASLHVMSRNNLWVRVLGSSSVMEAENRQRFAERVRKAGDKLQQSSSQLAMSGAIGGGRGGFGLGAASKKQINAELAQASQACAELAVEQCKGHASQVSKDIIFNFITKQAAKSSGKGSKEEKVDA